MPGIVLHAQDFDGEWKTHKFLLHNVYILAMGIGNKQGTEK